MATQVYLMRHAETAWSLAGRHTGRTDVPLTESGEQRAARLGTRLRGMVFAHVLTSPLQRARRTCELAGFCAQARIVPNLQEWHYGAYEGLTTAEIRAQRPGWNLFQDGCPGGESVEEISRRADAALATVRLLDGTVALFSHGHFLRVLAMRWIGLLAAEGARFALEPAALSILGFEHPRDVNPVVSLWNAGPVGD